MPEALSTASPPADKPAKARKPYPEFPLTPHPTGRWCKKIRGKIHYFGPIADPDAALATFIAQKDDLYAGRTPRPDPDALTVKDLANRFLNAKKSAVESGELTTLTFADYRTACDEIVSAFGKDRLVTDLRPDDFASLRNRMAAKWGPHRLAKTIQFIRCVFKYAFDAELIDRPLCFGPGFKRPSKKVLRIHRAQQGQMLFTADEIRRMIDAAPLPLRAMILLGINCGFGNADCGNLPLSALDLEAAIIDFPRPKTGVPRRCALWPETVAAIREALAQRPTPKEQEHAALVFLTRYGNSFHTGTPDGPLSREMGKLLRKLGIHRKRRGFYALRHCFRTIADEAGDQPAVDYVMGHEIAHMSTVYRESISDTRLRAVVNYVRKWIFPSIAFLETVE
jgi:integrase